MRLKFLIFALAVLAPVSALANGTVTQSGPVTPFHTPAWFGNGVQGDGGTTGSPQISNLGLFNGASCPFAVSSQTGAGTSASPYGQFSVCQTPTATILKVAGIGQSSPGLFFEINGIDYPFDGGGGGGGGGNSAAGPTGSPPPADASYTGFLSGSNLVGVSAANPFPVTNVGTGLVYPSPSGQSSNGVNVTVATISGECAQLKGAAGNLFSFSFLTSNPTNNWIWLVDTSLATVTGTLPQGTGSTSAVSLHVPWPVPASGEFDSPPITFPYVAASGILVCISSSATTITAPSGTISATGQRL